MSDLSTNAPSAVPEANAQTRGSNFRSNPFFLLSACCMLGGCIAASNSLSWVAIPLPRLLTLIGTLNVYEMILVLLGAFLVARRGLYRDGLTLLALEAFFLVDVSFLNLEISTGHHLLGLWIDLAVLVLAAIKLTVILRTLGVRNIATPMIFILLQLAAILAIPLVFHWIDTGSASPLWFYAGWWIAGLMPALYELLCWINRRAIVPREFRGIIIAFLVIPWLSLVGHLGVLHYDYGIDFYGADAAPLLLGLALVLNRAAPTALIPRRDLLVLRILLPLAAILVSANNPTQLAFHLHPGGQFLVTPLRLAICGAYCAIVFCLLEPYRIYFFFIGVAALCVNLFGPTPEQIYAMLSRASKKSSDAAWNFVPKSLAAWGAISMAASFVFLAIGAMVSLRKKPPTYSN
jgi:hypothetical protein